MSVCRPSALGFEKGDGIAQIIRTYLEENAPHEERYLRFYRRQHTLTDAIEKAAMAQLPNGKRFSHQRRIPHDVLTDAKEVLLRVQPEICACKSFDELFSLIERTVDGIDGIGELTGYDTAHRLGAYLNLRPELVYLHAGVRSGAKALGLNHRARKLPLSDFPAVFHSLLPEQVEDCLCIYKRELRTAR